MAYASILMHVEPDDTADSRIRLGAQLAELFNARLIGLGAEIFIPPAQISPLGYVGGDLLVLEGELVDQDLRRAHGRFESIASQTAARFEWRAEADFPALSVCANARAADLVIVARGPIAPDVIHRASDPAEILLNSGRPVLVVPPDVDRLDLDHVVVAWKDAREARRAVLDAIPLLQNARQVLVVEACEPDGLAGAEARVSDVVEQLRLHAVKATGRAVAARPDAAAALAEVIASEAPGLLVAGGYGHNRVREWALGGVTRDLLLQAPIPVLLSR